MGKRKVKEKTFIEIMLTVRGSWNGVNPCTKVEENKKKYSRTRVKKYEVE